MVCDNMSGSRIIVLEFAIIVESEQKMIRQILYPERLGKFMQLNTSSIIDESVLGLAQCKHLLVMKKSCFSYFFSKIYLHVQIFISPI
jgi:hypothetical protein